MEELFRKLGINPKNDKNYKIAFQHTSYANENHSTDYERLEFLGDAVVELVVSDYLYNKMNKKEGDMTKIRASYVCENALCEYAKDLNLSEYIKVGHGEEISGGRYKKVIMADIFEALMGAIYLEFGFEKARKVLLKIIVPYIEDPNVIFFSDYKGTLQEFVQTEKRSIVYELIDEKGTAQDKEFKIQAKIDNIVYGIGTAHNKKEAEQEAARDALNKLAIK